MVVLWVAAPCTLVGVYRRFRGVSCLRDQGDWVLLFRHLHARRHENLKSDGSVVCAQNTALDSYWLTWYRTERPPYPAVGTGQWYWHADDTVTCAVLRRNMWTHSSSHRIGSLFIYCWGPSFLVRVTFLMAKLTCSITIRNRRRRDDAAA
jgi:hypothetical protein